MQELIENVRESDQYVHEVLFQSFLQNRVLWNIDLCKNCVHQSKLLVRFSKEAINNSGTKGRCYFCVHLKVAYKRYVAQKATPLYEVITSTRFVKLFFDIDGPLDVSFVEFVNTVVHHQFDLDPKYVILKSGAKDSYHIVYINVVFRSMHVLCDFVLTVCKHYPAFDNIYTKNREFRVAGSKKLGRDNTLEYHYSNFEGAENLSSLMLFMITLVTWTGNFKPVMYVQRQKASNIKQVLSFASFHFRYSLESAKAEVRSSSTSASRSLHSSSPECADLKFSLLETIRKETRVVGVLCQLQSTTIIKAPGAACPFQPEHQHHSNFPFCTFDKVGIRFIKCTCSPGKYQTWTDYLLL